MTDQCDPAEARTRPLRIYGVPKDQRRVGSSVMARFLRHKDETIGKRSMDTIKEILAAGGPDSEAVLKHYMEIRLIMNDLDADDGDEAALKRAVDELDKLESLFVRLGR